MRRAQNALRWSTATLNEFNTGIGGQTAFDILGGFTQAEKDQTIKKIVRIHFRFYYKSQVANLSVFGRYGAIVENDDAFAAGSHLDPILDADGPWLINDHYHYENAAVGAESQQITEHDVKAQRLIKPKFTLAFIIDVNGGSNTGLDWGVGMRFLYESM